MSRTASLSVAGAVALLAASAAPPARAAQPYDSCAGFIDTLPAVIATQGTWCLRKDLSTPMDAGAAITIDTNNVTIDCNHFKLGGLSAGPGTQTDGIFATSRLNATVRNCNIRGFARGIAFDGAGSGHVVQDNRLDGNLWVGIYVAGTANTIRRNVVLDTGGSANSPWIDGIWIDGDADVVDNTVDGIVPSSSGVQSGSIGLAIATSSSAVARGNRIRRVHGGTGLVYGIINYAGSYATIRDNHVMIGETTENSVIGILCVNSGSRSGNRVYDFLTAYDGSCTDHGDNVAN